MRKHNGMRPQDVVILLAIIAQHGKRWLLNDLAKELFISASEVSESLNRSCNAQLIDATKKKINKHNLLDFLVHGVKYVFPAHPGALVRGMPTAYSAPPLEKIILGNEKVVWPYAKGEVRGFAVEPLYAKAVEAALNNMELYELLALTDALRIGRAREKDLAQTELKKRILDGK